MGTISRCTKCGKLIADRFPLHHCGAKDLPIRFKSLTRLERLAWGEDGNGSIGTIAARCGTNERVAWAAWNRANNKLRENEAIKKRIKARPVFSNQP